MTISEANAKAREGRIGGSSAPTVFGCNPYAQPVDEWLRLTGRRDSIDLSGNMAVHMGNVLEETLLKTAAEKHGWEDFTLASALGDPSYTKEVDGVALVSHLDGCRLQTRSVVECKNRSAHMASQYGEDGGGAEDVLLSDYVQCQHQMLVGDENGKCWDSAYLVAYFGGGDLRVFHFPRDDAFIHEELIPCYEKFWLYVQTDERPPMVYGHPSVKKYLAEFNDEVDGEVKSLGNRGDILHAQIQEASDQIKFFEQQKTKARNELLDLIGTGYVGTLSDGTAYRRKRIEKNGFSVQPTSFIEMRHVKRWAK